MEDLKPTATDRIRHMMRWTKTNRWSLRRNLQTAKPAGAYRAAHQIGGYFPAEKSANRDGNRAQGGTYRGAGKILGNCGRREAPTLVFRWSYGDGTYEDGAEVAHAYTQPGAYTVRLKVSAVGGVASEQTFAIVVKGVIPTKFDLSHNRRYREAVAP